MPTDPGFVLLVALLVLAAGALGHITATVIAKRDLRALLDRDDVDDLAELLMNEESGLDGIRWDSRDVDAGVDVDYMRDVYRDQARLVLSHLSTAANL